MNALFENGLVFTALVMSMAVLIYMLVSARGAQKRRISERLDMISRQSEAIGQQRTAAASRPWRGVLLAAFRYMEHLILPPGGRRREITALLQQAGFSSSGHTTGFVILKALTTLSLAILCAFIASQLGTTSRTESIAVGIIAGIVGFVLPNTILRRLITRRKEAITAAIPDALDLLVICTNAGYSMPQSIARVGSEMANISKPLSDELARLAQEMQVNTDQTTALRVFGDRLGIPGISTLVMTMIQSQIYGTPLTHALRTLAKAERANRMMLLEEQSGKLSSQITLPMMAFVVPSLMIIAGAPAFIQLLRTF